MPNNIKTLRYPHVANIEDHHTQQSLRLVWDQLRTNNESFSSVQDSLDALQTAIETLNTSITNVQTSVRETSITASKAAGQVAAIPMPNTPGGPIVVGTDPGDLVSTPDDPLPINTGTVTIEGTGAPAVFGFTKTASFLSFGIVPGTMFISSSGTDSWPAVSIDAGPPVQKATLWVLEYINGAWYAAGAERLRPEQVNGSKPEGNPSTVIPNDWLYDSGRWPTMAHYKPHPGQRVGLMLVAGDTRAPGNNTPVMERSNIIEVAWPTATGANPATVLWTEP